jgi:hypothetical protein
MPSDQKKAKISLSYCDKCDPKVALAIGNLSEPAKHTSPNGKVHEGKLIEIGVSECIDIGKKESPADFLSRMLKKYVK